MCCSAKAEGQSLVVGTVAFFRQSWIPAFVPCGDLRLEWRVGCHSTPSGATRAKVPLIQGSGSAQGYSVAVIAKCRGRSYSGISGLVAGRLRSSWRNGRSQL